ncbi:MAG TPA: hypothetical protein VMA98_12625 [Candidatus Acidoferrales bacterium]|nr:hypothetical protein [Candidatus Acidoferrales bacterium]
MALSRPSFLSACLSLGISAAAYRVLPAIASATEFELLRRISPVILDRTNANAMPDAEGNMQLNQGHWTAVVFQRVAMPLFWVGAVENDQQKVDAAWRAVDAAFAHQQPDGSFATGDGSPMPPTDMAFWLDALGHGLIVLQESPLGATSGRRIAGVLPGIARGASWLQQPGKLAVLEKGDLLGTNRVLIDANAFASVAVLLGDARFMTISDRLRDEALARLTPQGVLPENGGFDSSYQAVSLLHASYLYLRAPNSGLFNGLTIALNRELEAIDAAGNVSTAGNTRTGGQERVFGQVKRLDYSSVILGLLYSGLVLGRQDGVDAGTRVFRHAYHYSANL